MLQKMQQLKEPLEALLKLSRLVFYAWAVLGLILTLTYCSTINYYPSGVTIGDSFLFIVVSLLFAFGYAAIVLALYCAGVAISPLLRWLQKLMIFLAVKIKKSQRDINGLVFPKIELHHYAIVIAGYVSLFLIVILLIYYDSKVGIGLLLFTPLMGYYYGLWNSVSDEKTNKTMILLGVATTLLIAPVSFGLHGHVLKGAMTGIGITKNNAAVQLSKNYTQFLEQNGIKSPKGYGFFPNTDVLFNGIGANVFIEINGFKLIVPKAEIIIGYGNRPKTRVP